MTKLQKRALASMTALMLSGAGAMAADLYGGSLKDNGGYMPTNSGRPALFYARGDFTTASSGLGTITEAPNYVDDQAHISSSRSWGVGLGMYFTPNVRGDVTVDWSNAASVTGVVLDGGATLQGQRQFGVKHVVGLANLYYDFDTRSRFTPYLGVGLGFARNTTTAGTIALSGCDSNINGVANCSAAMDGSTKTNAAGALMAGFSARLGDRWSLDAGYRFLYLGDANTSDIQITRVVNNAAWPQSTPAVQVHDLYEHEFRVGLRMDLR